MGKTAPDSVNQQDPPEVPKTYIYKMYYTFCENPGCQACDDYADTRKEAEKNRRRHAASHRGQETL